MSNLTARYRPQTFAQVAGQDTLKAILSRAAAEDKVAPAYLFSGTRGVGKTTVARVFAKALNCRKAPAPEPCNECDLCRAVTLGNAVDVVEIDGASNRGIDDVRRLKEVVGYAPMDGRYKIFIIDEAHMLSREAFNALLKTLEEPPARVTFVMATTEPHKFPATIISRCQHYVFRRLSEAGLAAHLAGILNREGVAFEPSAVALIARRGAGSVRDSMSLLGQVLALGHGDLTEESARSVLGLAGREIFLRMLAAFRGGDSLALVEMVREMLGEGLDMGFFLREFTALWRNLFILRQNGEAAIPLLEMPEAEARALLAEAGQFSLSHIHASWQMTLEAQRRVLTSLEPALALELLFLNLAMLPQLLSLEELTALGRKPAGPSGPASPGSPGGPGGPGGPNRPGRPPSPGKPFASEGAQPASTPMSGPASAPASGPASGLASVLASAPASVLASAPSAPASKAPAAPASAAPEPDPAPDFAPGPASEPGRATEAGPTTRPTPASESEPVGAPPAGGGPAAPASSPSSPSSPESRPQRKHYEVLKKEVMNHPLLQRVAESFDASVVDFGQIREKKQQ